MIAGLKIAIQGELGSNSHMVAAEMLPDAVIIPCRSSAEVVDRVVSSAVDAAVLPFENSLHGSVADHNDLLLRNPLRLTRESLLRIRHNIIAVPGVRLAEVRRVLSHPVALSQCRAWLAAHPEVEAVPFYDTAGAVKHVLASGSRTEAGVAPELAARIYGGEMLLPGIEDLAENLTRFHLVVRDDDRSGLAEPETPVNKMSLAFAIDHRPGTLVRSLASLAEAGVNLSKIESRPVPGSPWQYIFHVDLRFESEQQADHALDLLAPETRMMKELGRYRAAEWDTGQASSTEQIPEMERHERKSTRSVKSATESAT